MSEQRTVAISNHLWTLLERMSREMGTPRDALLNQAIFTFARFNGYAGGEPGSAGPPAAVAGQEAELPRPAAVAPPPVPVAGRAGTDARATASRRLVLLDDSGAAWMVDGDRFVIGRGKHCDLVIESTRVSREHAAVLRQGDDWFLEDLGSSNGTWFEKARIDRKRLADGDEFFVCSERLRCLVR